MRALATNEAQVDYVLIDRLRSDTARLSRYWALLTSAERAQHDRFVMEHSRHEYLLTRALQRTMLSQFCDVAPQDFVFVRNPHGRPSIDAPSEWRRLRFNLTNTTGLVACIVASDREVGLDAEWLLRRARHVDSADRFFAPSEARALRACPPAAQERRFFDYWTLKESYIKARGMGLAIPLDQFAFVLGDEIRIHFAPELIDDPKRWRFEQYAIVDTHLLASCCERRGEETVRVVWQECVP